MTTIIYCLLSMGVAARREYAWNGAASPGPKRHRPMRRRRDAEASHGSRLALRLAGMTVGKKSALARRQEPQRDFVVPRALEAERMEADVAAGPRHQQADMLELAPGDVAERS